MKKVFLTGGSGFLGSAILQQLVINGYHVVALVRNLNATQAALNASDVNAENVTLIQGNILDTEILAKAIDGCSHLVHAAAIVSFRDQEADDMLKVNVEGTANVVNIALEYGKIEKMVYISSVSVLGPAKWKQVLTEKNGYDPEGGTNYGKSKYLAELEVFRGIEEGLTAEMVNPSIILGKATPATQGRSSLMLLEMASNGQSLYTKGSLNYVYVKDVVSTVMQLLARQNSGNRYILSAERLSFFDFFTVTAKAYKVAPPSINVPQWLAEIGWRILNIITFITGKSYPFTKETVKNAYRNVLYDGTKAQKELGLKYTLLPEILSEINNN